MRKGLRDLRFLSLIRWLDEAVIHCRRCTAALRTECSCGPRKGVENKSERHLIDFFGVTKSMNCTKIVILNLIHRPLPSLIEIRWDFSPSKISDARFDGILFDHSFLFSFSHFFWELSADIYLKHFLENDKKKKTVI